MTNPVAAIRMLITYVVIIPVAVLVGYLLTNPLDFGTLGFLGLVMLIIISPIFIKWHYPILVFGLACPMTCFFLIGRPPLAQVVILLCLGIAIVERTINSEKRFLRVPAMTWPLLFIAGMAYMTAELTGGLGLHSLGGETGGGKKYIALFVGIAGYFALTSQAIPREKWKWYLALSILPSLMGMIGDLFPLLPSPLNYVNLLFPPSVMPDQDVVVGVTRLRSFSFSIGAIAIYLLARYGLRGLFDGTKPWRVLLFLGSVTLTLFGGFRASLIGLVTLITLMFFLEGMHRTRLLPLLILAGALGGTLLWGFSDKLPFTFQRSLSFLPLKWDGAVIADAEGSSEWRFSIWRATWPKVPQYLLLGKGYSLNKQDFDLIGSGQFTMFQSSHIEADSDTLAISGDYHSGPLSTLMGFGIWGAIGILWLMAATVFVTYRNFKYGDPELRVFNVYLLASSINCIVFFFFIFGGFQNDVGSFARLAGFSIAMNGGLARPAPKAAYNPRIKPLPEPQPA